jgi:hypothetical protein
MADQRLVRHLHFFSASQLVPRCNNQSCVSEARHEGDGRRGVTSLRHQLSELGPPPCVPTYVVQRLVPTELRESNEDVADLLLLIGSEAVIHGVGRASDGLLDAPRRSILVRRQPATVASVPELEQRMLQQRHRSRLSSHVIQDFQAHACLETEAYFRRLLFHSTAQFLRNHRWDELLVRLHRSA